MAEKKKKMKMKKKKTKSAADTVADWFGGTIGRTMKKVRKRNRDTSDI